MEKARISEFKWFIDAMKDNATSLGLKTDWVAIYTYIDPSDGTINYYVEHKIKCSQEQANELWELMFEYLIENGHFERGSIIPAYSVNFRE